MRMDFLNQEIMSDQLSARFVKTNSPRERIKLNFPRSEL